MRTLREDMFFRSLDRICHDVSGTEHFRIVERSHHDQCGSVNGTQTINSRRIQRIEWVCISGYPGIELDRDTDHHSRALTNERIDLYRLTIRTIHPEAQLQFRDTSCLPLL